MNKIIFFKSLFCFLLLPILCVQSIQAAVNDSQVARWKDNKPAAFYLCFDDGEASAFQVTIPELLKRNLMATFYVNPGGNKWSINPNLWENVIPKQGMSYGNHTWTHRGAADLATQDDEIRLCQEKILSIFYTDNKPHLMSYAQPGVDTWFSYGQELTDMLVKYNLIRRPISKGRSAVYSLHTVKEMLDLADNAIATKGSDFLLCHGVERKASEGDPDWHYQDFWALSKDTLRGVLDGLAARRDRGDLWITDHISQYKYQMERDNATFQVLNADENVIQLAMSVTLDQGLYDLPLTVITQVPGTWVSAKVTIGTKTVAVPVIRGLAQYDAFPNGELITLTKSTDPAGPIGTLTTTYLVQQGGSGSVWSGVTGTVVDLTTQGKSLNEWYKATTFEVGDEIWLIKGTYLLTDSLVTTNIETIRGGFDGTEKLKGDRAKGTNAWDFTNETILDGNNSVRGLVSTTGATVDGLTIQNCNVSISNTGAGAKITNSSILQNCIIRNNTTTGTNSAGGVFLTTNAKLLNSYVHHNSNTVPSGVGVVGGGGVYYSQLATLDGCTISYNTANTFGGGVNVDGKTGGAVINNCIISNNESIDQGGGGVNISNTTTFGTGLSVTISNCTISSNTAKSHGGGLYIDVPVTVKTSATWQGNPVNITNCIISSNTTTSNGGGIYMSRGKYTINGCTINNNVSSAISNGGNGGGGLCIIPYSYGSILNVSNSILKGNSIAGSQNGGSAIKTDVASIIVRNCLITENIGATCHTQGAGRTSTFQNCTFAANQKSTGEESSIYLGSPVSIISIFTNCLFYKCGSIPITGTINTGKDPLVTYCGFDVAVPTTYADKTGCITGLTNAAFADAINGDWHLASGSTAIDAGTTIAACSPDIAGITRPQGTSYDMGAYESTFTNIATSVNSSSLTLTANNTLSVLSGGELIIDASKTLKSITVNPGGKVTLNNTKSLTLNNDFTIVSDASGTGTFVDSNANGELTINGTASVQQYLTGLTGTSTRAYWYLSSPVSAATTAVFNVVGGINKLTYYDETVTGYATQFSTNATTLTKGVGYVAYIGGADAAYTFSTNTGAATTKLNTGAITLTPTRTGITAAKRGFNLVGNPYPSFLDWNAVVKTNIRPTIWYRTYTSGSTMQFDTFDGTNGTSLGINGLVSQYIPPMQAFWVKVTTDGLAGSLVLNNTMRSHQNQSLNNRLRAPSVEKSPVLRLKVSNGINADEALVVVNTNATDGFDPYDSPKMPNNNVDIPEIYTLLGNEEIVINNLNDISTNKELELGFRTGKSNVFSIKASQASNFNAETRIILKDNLLNKELDITEGAVYDFSSDIIDNATRFKILFRTVSITTGVEFNETDNDKVFVYKNTNKQIVVNCVEASNKNAMLTVHNFVGQKIVQTSTTGLNTVIEKSFNQGIYFVTVTIADKNITKKVIIN